jgi:hypothetical protein
MTVGNLPAGMSYPAPPSSVIEYCLEDATDSIAITLGGTVTLQTTSSPTVFQFDVTAS